MGGLETCDIELDHLQHRLHDALRLGRIGVAEQFRQYPRHDLPGDAEAILQPAAPLDGAADRKPIPKPVDFCLVRAIHLERDRVRVLEAGAAVERQEALPGQGEIDDQHASGFPGGTVGDVPLHMVDARVGEQRYVELGGFLSLAVEPQAWRNLRHWQNSSQRLAGRAARYSANRSRQLDQPIWCASRALAVSNTA